MSSHPDRFPVPLFENLGVVFPDGASLRCRSVGERVLVGILDIPVPPLKVVADWELEIVELLDLEPGDVETLPMARTRMRWPDLKHCMEATNQWAQAQGLTDALNDSAPTLMACRGARYHHDAVQYGAAAFCNLFLSEDKGLDLHFPAIQLRVPLQRGLVVLFDTGQPHAVISRECTAFDPADFPQQSDCSQVFLTWELPIGHPKLAHSLGVAWDIDAGPTTDLSPDGSMGQLWRNGVPTQVHPATGEWG